MGEIRVVLFDMGGVVVALGGLEEVIGAEVPEAELWGRWLASPTVRDFERGRCSIDDFASGLLQEFDMDIDEAELIERFRTFPRGLFPGAADLVANVRERVPVGVLSNTNQLHWEQQIDGELIREMFDHEFVSYALDMVKPDREIFEHIVGVLGCAPAEILFLDDNQLNVDGARAVGLEAGLARGVDEAAAVLRTYNLLPPD